VSSPPQAQASNRPPAASTGFSPYDNTSHIQRVVSDGHHRAVIGGLWHELGTLQADFLKQQGLRPQDTFIDVGAGSFRAGVKLIPYLDGGNYYAIDRQAALLEAGYQHEIESAGLAGRFPRQHFAATADFDVSGFDRIFDAGIAQSVFTHMPLTRLADCLAALAPHFRDGGRFYVTLFLCREEEAQGLVTQHPGGVVTTPTHDPFHTTLSALSALAARAPRWRMEVIGDWNHPRNQKMVLFTREKQAVLL
jgi:hypothetical protein